MIAERERTPKYILAAALFVAASVLAVATGDYVSETHVRILMGVIMLIIAVEFVRIIRSRRFADLPLMIGLVIVNAAIFAAPPWKSILAGIGLGIAITLLGLRVFKIRR